MDAKKIIAAVAVAVLVSLAAGPLAWANKSSVVIEAPASVVKGAEVTVRINVLHEGNNFLHHTKWARVKVNGEEMFLWDFGWFGTPESNNFSREITLIINEPTEIMAEASCNIHGGEPPAKVMISLRNQ